MRDIRVSNTGLDLCRKFEGKPRLTARLCEGGRYEVGYGCTYYANGLPVGPDDTITEDMVEPMLRHCMQHELRPLVDAIDESITLEQHQWDALAAWSYNIGGHAAAKSAAVTGNINAGRFSDAATGFSQWTGATSPRPSKTLLRDSYYADVIGQDRNGVARWLAPDEGYATYFLRMRGLLRRNLAIGCVFSGYPWEIACSSDAVFMAKRRDWDAGNRMWRDTIISQTRLRDVLSVARQHTLAEPDFGEMVAAAFDDDELVIRARSHPVAGSLPDRAATGADSPAVPIPEGVSDPAPQTPPPAPQAPVKPAPVPVMAEPVKAPVVAAQRTYELDASKPTKAMEESDRWRGSVAQAIGRSTLRIAHRGVFGTALAGVAAFISEDPELTATYVLLATSVVLLGIGFLTSRFGDAIRARGEHRATQALH